MNIQIALFNYRLLTGAPRRFYNYWGNYPIYLRVTHIEPGAYLECFYTWDVPKQGGASRLAQFMRKYVNTVVALWCGAKQPKQDRPEEVVSVRFHLNPGEVHLQCKRNQPSNWKKQHWSQKAPKVPLSIWTKWSRTFTYAPLCCFHVEQSAEWLLLSFVNSRFSWTSLFLCLSPQIWMKHFTSLLHKLPPTFYGKYAIWLGFLKFYFLE